MAAKKKKRPVESTDELQARVLGKLAGKVSAIQTAVLEPREIVRRTLLEGLDDLLDDS